MCWPSHQRFQKIFQELTPQIQDPSNRRILCKSRYSKIWKQNTLSLTTLFSVPQGWKITAKGGYVWNVTVWNFSSFVIAYGKDRSNALHRPDWKVPHSKNNSRRPHEELYSRENATFHEVGFVMLMAEFHWWLMMGQLFKQTMFVSKSETPINKVSLLGNFKKREIIFRRTEIRDRTIKFLRLSLYLRWKGFGMTENL